MNHVITLKDLLLALGFISSIILICIGGLMSFGDMMSDNEYDNDSNSGCIMFVIGVLLWFICLFMVL